MELIYQKTTHKHLDLLVDIRIEVLRAANKLDSSVDMTTVKEQSYLYYKKALEDEMHTAYLVYHGTNVVGAGGISFYQVMPTFHNPTGKKAYIMNMFTRLDYRRKGIAFKTLDYLIADAKEKGVLSISLEATDMGRPLYEKYGFINMKDEMEYKLMYQ